MLHLFIKNLTGDTIKIEAKSDDLIKKIKGLIYEKNDILPHKQILILNENELEDDKKISEYNIKDYETIHLKIKMSRIKINIIVNKINTELVVDFDDTIEKVKNLYNKKTNQNIKFLVLSGKTLNYNMNVKTYDIQEKSSIIGYEKLPGGKK